LIIEGYLFILATQYDIAVLKKGNIECQRAIGLQEYHRDTKKYNIELK